MAEEPQITDGEEKPGEGGEAEVKEEKTGEVNDIEPGSLLTPEEKGEVADPKGSDLSQFDWRSAVMEQLEDNTSKKDRASFEKWVGRYDNLGDFARNAFSLRQKASQPNRIPDEGSSDEEKAAFYKTLGVPDAVEGYEIEAPEWAKEDEDYAKQMNGVLERFRTEGNYTKDQAKLATDVYNELRVAEAQAAADKAQTHRAEIEEELTKQHGFDLEANTKTVRSFIGQHFTPEAQHVFMNARLATGEYVFDNVDIFNGLLKVAKEMGEDTLANGLMGTSMQSDIEAEIKAVRADLTAKGIDHLSTEAQDRLEPLYRRRSGTKNLARHGYG